MLRILSAICLATFAIAASNADATPRYGETSIPPTWKAYLAPGETARIPADCSVTDYHAYDGHNGRAFRQRRDSEGNYWTSGRRTVASVYGRTFFTHARKRGIIVAAWCASDDTVPSPTIAGGR